MRSTPPAGKRQVEICTAHNVAAAGTRRPALSSAWVLVDVHTPVGCPVQVAPGLVVPELAAGVLPGTDARMQNPALALCFFFGGLQSAGS